MKKKQLLNLLFLCIAIQISQAQKKEVGLFFGLHAF